MTTREYFQAVLDAHLSEDMDNASRELIAKLDARNEKRKTTETKDQKAAKERRQLVLDFLVNHQGEVFTRDAIAAAIGVTDTQVSSACKTLIENDTIAKTTVKVDKARKVGYYYPVEE